MSWNYRIVSHGEWCGLHEVHYNAAGSVTSFTANPVTFVCDSEEQGGIVASLRRALTDAERLPVLVASELFSIGEHTAPPS